MSKLAWRVIASESVVRDRWISLRADRCEMPSGHIIDPYYVFEYPPVVSVLALTPDQQVVLVRQYRHGIGRDVVELPGGWADRAAESVADAARRELLEETGYTGENFTETGSFAADPSKQPGLVHFFLARDVKPTAEPEPDEHESIEIVLMPLTEVVERFDRGEFPHALQLGALFFGLRALGCVRIG